MRFVFETKQEAIDFIDMLEKDIAEYGSISIERAYSIATGDMFTNRPYYMHITGWKEIGTIMIDFKEGYVVDLPKAEKLFQDGA